MNILVISNGYPDSKEPQYGCFERDQAMALMNAGHKVSIMYVDGRTRLYWRKLGISKREDNGLKIYSIFYFPMKWGRTRLTCGLHQKVERSMLDKVYRFFIKDNEKPDVVFAHYLWNISYATILKDKYNLPLVGMEHWSGLTYKTLSHMAKYWGEIAYPKVDKLLAVSNSLRVHIYNHFGIEATVVNDMLGPEFLNTSMDAPPKNRQFTFITVGNLLPIKCYDLLIDAFAKSKLSEKDCKLVIVGEGTERSRLQKMVKNYKLAESITFVGRKGKEDIRLLLISSHVYVLSSKAETFGVACIEAMSQGLPVIATRCGGTEEFMNKKNGLLVPVGNAMSMANAMCQMYKDIEQYDRNDIAAGVRQKFAPLEIANRLTNIFLEIIK